MELGVEYKGDMVRILQCGRDLGRGPLSNGRASEKLESCVRDPLTVVSHSFSRINPNPTSPGEKCRGPEADGANELKGLLCDPPSCELAKTLLSE